MNKSIGKERIYNKAFADRGRENVILWDVQKVENGQLIKVTFMGKNSPYHQGIRLATDIGIEVNGQVYPSIMLWEHTAPKEVICRCLTNDGLLSIYNIWDEGDGRESQAHSSGMLLEEKDNILIYHANDYGFETNFDKLVFSIEKM